MEKYKLAWLLIVVTFFLAGNDPAQTAAPTSTPPVPSPTSSEPTKDDGDVVKIRTDLIQVDAVVTDKDGKQVTDLKPEDFVILENGKEQKITNFSYVTGVRTTVEKSTTKVDKSAPASPPVPSNLRPDQVKRVVALVVDDLGLSFASTEWTKQALKKFVDEQIQPGELVAIIRTSSGVGALQQFTTDKRLLYAAIERIRWNQHGRGGIGSFSPIEPNLSEVENGAASLSGGTKSMGGIEEERQFKRDALEAQEGIFAAGTLGAVNFVMRGMAQIPGRKAVILFSDGFSLFSRKGLTTRVQEGLQRLTDTANRSGVIIYTMDARGLDSPMLSAQDDTYGLTGDQVNDRLDVRTTDYLDTQQSLRYIAEQTGGFAIINQNNLSKGLQKILEDQKSYYLVGYQPDDDIFDIEKRRFNKLTIKVKRPGLQVRYRSGFFGMTDDEAKPAPKNAVQQLIAALTSPFSSKDIDLRVTSLFAGDNASGTFMRSLIYIKPSDLKFTEDKDGMYKAEFDISALTFGDTGEVVDQVNRKQTIRAEAKSLQSLYKEGLVCQVTLPVQKPGAYQMRVALRDSATGRIGSASQYIEVPNLKKKNLTLSGIVLERVETKAANSAEDAKTLEIKTQRDAALRRFHNGDIIRFGLSVYNAKLDKASRKPVLSMQYKVFRDGKEIFASPEKPLNSDQQQTYQVIDTADAFSLGKNMTQGDYVVQVIVKDPMASGSRQLATQWTDFEILP